MRGLSLRFVRAFLSLVLLALAFVLVGANLDFSLLSDAFHRVSLSALAESLIALGIGVLFSSWRFQLVARDLGYHLTFRQAVATLSVSQLAAALFFQLAGQLIARGAMLSRLQIPVSATIVMTGYERVSALIVSLVLAAAGAVYLFGGITLNYANGGALLLKAVLGLSLVVFAGAVFVWGHLLKALVQQITRQAVIRFVRNLSVSLLVQAATMASYVLLTHSLVPEIGIVSITAAAALVMFAASIPISFAGWGVRELSAIYALGVLGVAKHDALVAAVIVGIGSLIVLAVCVLASIGTLNNKPEERIAAHQNVPSFDYLIPVAYLLPLAVATVISFQLFLPSERGFINVNLADPFAVLAGCVFLLLQIQTGSQGWRISGFEWHVVAATVAMMAAFAHGFYQFGWSQWAFANKTLGWFVLLAYGATGALIVRKFNEAGLDLLLRTFAVVAAAIVVFDVTIILAFRSGLDSLRSLTSFPLDGFSQNRNAFAFYLLLAGAVTLASNWPRRDLLFAVILAGIWYSGSRTAFITLPPIVAVAVYFRLAPIGLIAKSIVLGVVIVAIPVFVPELFTAHENYRLNDLFSSASSNVERIRSLEGGLRMFSDHLLFGAGLGAYYEQELKRGVALVVHSTPIWLLAEMGLVGFLVFVAPVARVFLTELRRKQWDVPGGVLVLIIITFAVFSNAHEILYQRSFWLLFGACCAMRYFPAALAQIGQRGRPLF